MATPTKQWAHELPTKANLDPATVEGFGEEWVAFDQGALPTEDLDSQFDDYFHIFPFDRLPPDAEGFDLGCGSGRWASKVAPLVGTLHCIDPSAKALEVARRKLGAGGSARFHLASVDSIPLAEASQDFGYCLGVLHHVPDTAAGLKDATAKLKAGAPFLLYLYYALDNRPIWFRGLWRLTDIARKILSRQKFAVRRTIAEIIAAGVYWPMARAAAVAERAGARVEHWPLAWYRHGSFYRMRTDALDRFGTRLEQRFTKAQIETMMSEAGLKDLRFSERAPFWVALGFRA